MREWILTEVIWIWEWIFRLSAKTWYCELFRKELTYDLKLTNTVLSISPRTYEQKNNTELRRVFFSMESEKERVSI